MISRAAPAPPCVVFLRLVEVDARLMPRWIDVGNGSFANSRRESSTRLPHVRAAMVGGRPTRFVTIVLFVSIGTLVARPANFDSVELRTF